MIAAFSAGSLPFNTRFYRALGWVLVVAYLFWLIVGLRALITAGTAALTS